MDRIIESLLLKIRDASAGKAPLDPSAAALVLDLRSGMRDLKAELSAYQDMALKVSGILSELDLDLVLTRLLDAAVDLSGADRGFLVQRTSKEVFEVVRARDFNKADLDGVQEEFSRSLVEQTVRLARPMLVSDVRQWDGLKDHSSVRRQGILSFMVVPFRSDGVVLGAIYLDTRQASRLFSPEIAKRVDLLAQQAAPALKQANLLAELKRANGALREQFRRLHDIESVVGTSPALQRALAVVCCVAPTNAPVLLTGETGTGKDLIAQIIHRNSPRSAVPLVTLNCAAIPATLLESELFGHREGAFTGAVRANPGKIAQAEGGTLFLDEVSELSDSLQAKMLRFIQHGDMQRVGEDRPVRVDVRILAAANKDLSAEVKAGRFRQDLFYRLSVVAIELPPLRERREDLPLLIEHFLAAHSPERKRRVSQLAPDVLHCLQDYDYPGNVRELESAVRRCCLLAGEGEIRIEHLPEPIALFGKGREGGRSTHTAEDLKRTKDRVIADIERTFLVRALERSGGSVSQAARECGMKRSRLQYLMRKRGIDSRRWRKEQD